MGNLKDKVIIAKPRLMCTSRGLRSSCIFDIADIIFLCHRRMLLRHPGTLQNRWFQTSSRSHIIQAYGKTCDISDRASLDEFVAYAVSIAPIGNVVNAAGVDAGASELIWKVNVQGTINVVEAFLPYIGGSCLVNY